MHKSTLQIVNFYSLSKSFSLKKENCHILNASYVLGTILRTSHASCFLNFITLRKGLFFFY